jgi:hypothetical protein
VTVTVRLLSPHDDTLSGLSTTELLRRWQGARTRALAARHGTRADADDLFTELVVGQRIATEVTCGRWCVVAQLLKAHALDTWAQVGTALDITETEARDGFHTWITGQADLRRRTGTIGLTETDADHLYKLSEAVPW